MDILCFKKDTIMPFELLNQITKDLDINTIRLVNKSLCAVNMDRYTQHIINTICSKDITGLQKPFMVHYMIYDSYKIFHDQHIEAYCIYDSNFSPNNQKQNGTYQVGAYHWCVRPIEHYMMQDKSKG